MFSRERETAAGPTTPRPPIEQCTSRSKRPKNATFSQDEAFILRAALQSEMVADRSSTLLCCIPRVRSRTHLCGYVDSSRPVDREQDAPAGARVGLSLD
jgi:hypothetical protein